MSSVTINQEKNQTIYKAEECLESDSESELQEVVTIDNHPSEVLSQGLATWQKLIGDYKINDVGEIIEQLMTLSNEQPENVHLRKALMDARNYHFQKSMIDRKKILVRKDLDKEQFKNRVEVSYDKNIPDEQYKIILESKQHFKKAASKPKPDPKPTAPKNWGTKRVMPTPQEKKPDGSPADWLLGGGT